MNRRLRSSLAVSSQSQTVEAPPFLYTGPDTHGTQGTGAITDPAVLRAQPSETFSLPTYNPGIKSELSFHSIPQPAMLPLLMSLLLGSLLTVGT